MESSPVPPGTIVVGVDGSSAAEVAVRWAAEQACLGNRQLTLVHAVRMDSAFATVAGPERATVVESLTSDGQAILRRSRDVALAALRRGGESRQGVVRCELRKADPRAALVQLSREAALLVLGSRGHGRLRSQLFGSVGAAVADRAYSPVVVIRPRRAGMVRRGILVGVDGTEASMPALEFAYQQADLRGLPLTVLHVDVAAIKLPAKLDTALGAGPSGANPALVLAESVAGLHEQYPGVHVTLSVGAGAPGRGLVERGELMDMVVVGNTRMSWFGRLLADDVSRAVLEESRTVVAVVPARSRAGRAATRRGA